MPPNGIKEEAKCAVSTFTTSFRGVTLHHGTSYIFIGTVSNVHVAVAVAVALLIAFVDINCSDKYHHEVLAPADFGY